MLLQEKILTEANGDFYKEVNDFMQKDYRYFFNDEFRNDELNTLSGIAIGLADLFNEYKFTHYKNVLQKQLEVYESSLRAQ